MPKYVTRSGAHLRGLVPGQHSSKETSPLATPCQESNPRFPAPIAICVTTELTAGLTLAYLRKNNQLSRKHTVAKFRQKICCLQTLNTILPQKLLCSPNFSVKNIRNKTLFHALNVLLSNGRGSEVSNLM